MGAASGMIAAVWAVPTSTLAVGMIIAGCCTFATLMIGIVAPYGRYSAPGWGFFIESKLAWVNAALLAMFLVHYFNRDLIFPLRLRGGKPTPFVVWLAAAIFCIYNGYMQAKYLLTEAPMDSHITPQFLMGAAVWLAGWLINLQADHILINLRKPGEKGYKIPRGGVFEYVSAANYFGEMVEWAGWALASRSLPAFAFAFFTFANLAPRGWRHHLWYKNKFPRYPKGRRAVIPFLW